MKDKIFIDAIVKYVVLLICTAYLGIILWQNIVQGKEITIPQLIVVLITLVFNYHFRKSPKDNGGQDEKNN